MSQDKNLSIFHKKSRVRKFFWNNIPLLRIFIHSLVNDYSFIYFLNLLNNVSREHLSGFWNISFVSFKTSKIWKSRNFKKCVWAEKSFNFLAHNQNSAKVLWYFWSFKKGRCIRMEKASARLRFMFNFLYNCNKP